MFLFTCQSVVKASEPRAKASSVEVHEKSRRASGELQIGDHLRQVHGKQDLDGLQLHDEAALDQQVQLQLAPDGLSLVHAPFALNAELRGCQLDDQALALHALQ